MFRVLSCLLSIFTACGVRWLLQSWMIPAISETWHVMCWVIVRRVEQTIRLPIHIQTFDEHPGGVGYYWIEFNQSLSVFTTKRRWNSRKYWMHLISAWVNSPQNASESWCDSVYSPQNAGAQTSRKYRKNWSLQELLNGRVRVRKKRVSSKSLVLMTHAVFGAILSSIPNQLYHSDQT